MKIKRNRKTVRKASAVRQIFPDSVVVDLKYGDYMMISAGTGSMNSYFFNANSCYDPNLTGTGHQPLGFDQYMAFYEAYVVEGATMELLTSTSSTTPVRVSLTASKEYASVPTGMEYVAEWPQTNIDVVTAQRPVHLNQTASTSEFYGVATSELPAVDALVGSSAANPASLWYFRIYVQADDYSSTVTANCLVRLTQRVRFFKRKLLTPS